MINSKTIGYAIKYLDKATILTESNNIYNNDATSNSDDGETIIAENAIDERIFQID